MKLNLYDPNEFTKDGVRRLLASKTGKESSRGLYQLRVTKDGIAYIEHDDGEYQKDVWENHALVFSWWRSSYVGNDAANDNEWVTYVYNTLTFWWNECLEFGPHRLPDAFYAS
jgi:hypothetical protein